MADFDLLNAKGSEAYRELYRLVTLAQSSVDADGDDAVPQADGPQAVTAVSPLAAAQGEAKAKATCRCQLSLLAQVASQDIHPASHRGSRSRMRDWQGRGVRRASRTPQWAP